MDQSNAIEIRHMTKTFKIYKDKQKTLKERLTRRKGAMTENVVLDDISLDIKRRNRRSDRNQRVRQVDSSQTDDPHSLPE
ncbi:hypothetical protein [Allobaculum sp. Allo2]|uniref:hypothetical protein n=1 Tax=Allobaculum sp. Allo2 TaxID=2853432 RepID=UPI001F60C9A7|nr:hypothetical protein [Allobaculum sp. Allo2]